MNIKTANRLCDLRKKHNLSQEDLANKLGVSRQAVSKWERSESSPDTDNLIQLAKLYNITLDELLNDKEDETVELIEENNEAKKEENESVQNKEDEDKDSEDEELTPKQRSILSGIAGAGAVLITAAYLLLGFCVEHGFRNYWFLFILIPVIYSIPEAIFQKRVSHFNYPCLVTAIYCAIGMIGGIWHPTWALFISIPVFYMITGGFEVKFSKD